MVSRARAAGHRWSSHLARSDGLATYPTTASPGRTPSPGGKEACRPPGPERRQALIVDEWTWWVEGLERVLERLEVEVVGRATLPSAGLAMLARLKPDVLVTSVDAAPPEPPMERYLAHALELSSELKIVVLSQRDDLQHVEDAFASGATAYVTRRAQPEDVALAIRHAFQPAVYLSVGDGRVPRQGARQRVGRQPGGLTRREVEVLCLAARGHSNAELARILWVTEQTVKFHLSNIYRKLGVSNRTEASRWASSQGLTAGPHGEHESAGHRGRHEP